MAWRKFSYFIERTELHNTMWNNSHHNNGLQKKKKNNRSVQQHKFIFISKYDGKNIFEKSEDMDQNKQYVE